MARKAVPVDLEAFEDFWARYPRREAKKDALKAWTKLAPSQTVLDTIHAALDWQVEMLEAKDRCFRPLPATWLRGERFLDEDPNARRRKPALTEEEQAMSDLLDRAGVPSHHRYFYFAGVKLRGETILVANRQIGETIVRSFGDALKQAYGGPMRVKIEP